MPDQPFFDAVADHTAHEIVARYAGDCAHAQALKDAIARLARAGLEASVQLFEQKHGTEKAP